MGSAPHHHHVLTAVSGSWWSGPLDRRGIASADSRDGHPAWLSYPFDQSRRLHDKVRSRQRAKRAPNADQHRVWQSFWTRFISRFPGGTIKGLAVVARSAPRRHARRQFFRWRAEDSSRIPDRHAWPYRDEAANAARSFRRRGIWPQSRDHQTLGQGGALVAYLDRPPARRAGTGRARDRCACGR